MTALKVDIDYLSKELDRHGNERIYARKYGRRIRIREAAGTAEFARAFANAIAELDQRACRDPNAPTAIAPINWPPASFGWLAAKYFGSGEFGTMDPESQNTRRRVIEECLREPHSDSDPDPMGNCPLKFFTSLKVKRLRDLKIAKGLPGAANNRRKYLSAMFGWAIEDNKLKSNPARDVRRAKYATNGFYTWTEQDLQRFLERHGPGTKARLAMAILLFVGVRRSDMVRLGPDNLHVVTLRDADGKEQHTKVLRFVPHKTRYQRVIESEKPVLPVLDEIISTSAIGSKTFLETAFGKPFSSKGFGNWMRDRCDEAGLTMCTAHGLRKLGATVAAELNATEHQLMAMFDWSSPQQASVYTRAARRKLLAKGAMPLLSVLGAGITPASKGVH